MESTNFDLFFRAINPNDLHKLFWKLRDATKRKTLLALIFDRYDFDNRFETPIDFSSRLYNILVEYFRTNGDCLPEKITIEQFKTIRNAGDKSYNELQKVLKEWK